MPEPKPSGAELEKLEQLESELDELKAASRKLIAMLDDEIGRRWMTFPLKLQVETVERLSDYYWGKIPEEFRDGRV